MSRALKFHHRERLKKKRRNHWGRDLRKEDSNWLSFAVNTPCSCSCHMCGNPRRHFKEITVQEKKENARLVELEYTSV